MRNQLYMWLQIKALDQTVLTKVFIRNVLNVSTNVSLTLPLSSGGC